MGKRWKGSRIFTRPKMTRKLNKVSFVLKPKIVMVNYGEEIER